MKFSLKTIAVIWVVLLLVVGGFIYSAYSRLKPDTFVTLVKEQIEKNYPGAELSVGEVDYSMTVDFSLHMKTLMLTRGGKVLGSIADMEVKIPWWLLLLNRGSAHINISGLEIFVEHDPEKLPDPVQEAENKNSRTIRVVLPNYLADAKFTIKAKNISFRDIATSRRYIRLSKLLVREFQYGKNSAFELNIPIEINHRGAQYTSDLWLFGDVTPEQNMWLLNYRGEFRTRDSQDKMQMEDLIIDGKASFNPSHLNVESTLDLLVEKESVGKGSFKANDNLLNIDLKLHKFPLSFIEMVDQELKNPFLKEISGTSSGHIKLSKSADQDFTQLKGRLDFDGPITLGEASINGKWKLIADGSKWETSFISPKGEVSFFRRSLIDFSRGIISQYNQELGFSGVDFALGSPTLLSLGHLINDPSTIFFNSTVSFKKCLQDKKIIDGEVKYGVSPDQRFYTSHLVGEGSSLNMNYQEKNALHQLSLDAHNFPVTENFQMLDPYFKAKNAVLTGKFEGKWTTVWHDGTWLSTLDLSKLDKASGLLPDLISKAAQQYNLDTAGLVHQSWMFSHKNKVTNVTSVQLDGTDPAKISGSLSAGAKTPSYLILNYPKNKLWKPVRKDLTDHLIPTKEVP